VLAFGGFGLAQSLLDQVRVVLVVVLVVVVLVVVLVVVVRLVLLLVVLVVLVVVVLLLPLLPLLTQRRLQFWFNCLEQRTVDSISATAFHRLNL